MKQQKIPNLTLENIGVFYFERKFILNEIQIK